MLKLFYSNRLEPLVSSLTAQLTGPRKHPLQPEIIVIPNHGMARWLSLRIADEIGVSANLKFLFPAEFLWNLLHQLLDDVPRDSLFRPAALSWRLYGLFPELLKSGEFPALSRYLQGSDEAQQFALAERLAASFDQYLVYRPDWIAQWDAGQLDSWQAKLWHRLKQDTVENHWVELQQKYGQQLSTIAAQKLPERVNLFAASALSPSFLDMFVQLGKYSDINLFQINPSQHYWGDIVAEKQISRRRLLDKNQTEYLEAGNNLLASWGTQGRDALDILNEYDAEIIEHYRPPGEHSLLAHIQSNIFELQDSTEISDRYEVQAADQSVQIHNCHSPVRELEVLHDQLLELFQNDPSLQPDQVAILTPDLTSYAPYIDAVFGVVPEAEQIPYHIAGLRQVTAHPVIGAFFALLDTASGRFENDKILRLLENSAIRARFELEEHDLPLIQKWVTEANIRWGYDETSREKLDLPSTTKTSWRAGLDRLLLGYALQGDGQQLFASHLPYDDLETSQAEILGYLAAFISRLASLRDGLSEPKTVAAWREYLMLVLDEFFLPDDDDAFSLQNIRQVLEEQATAALKGGFADVIPLSILQNTLNSALEEIDSGSGFNAGSVTFSTLAPLRNIPFKVIALIGMNDGAFPRLDRRPGFDLMASHWQRGDRSQRDEDRYLFLEAILAARSHLYISYVGQSIRDNASMPAAVLVSELVDYIDQNTQASNDGDTSSQLLYEHRLQGFNADYFNAESIHFSYSTERLQASQQLIAEQHQSSAFMTAPLGQVDAESSVISIEHFINAFKNPARHLLRERLSIQLTETGELPDPREPFEISGFAQRDFQSALLAQQQNEMSSDESQQIFKASGQLPEGQVGRKIFADNEKVVSALREKIAIYTAEVMPLNIAIDLSIGPITINGQLPCWSNQYLLDCQPGKIYSGDYLSLWIKHLLIQAQTGQAYRSVLLRGEGEKHFKPVENPLQLLSELVSIYEQIQQQATHFFPRSSFAYIEVWQKKPEAALSKAKIQWRGGSYDKPYPESKNAYYQLLFANSDPIDDAFEAITQQILTPLFEYTDDEADSEGGA